MIEETDQAPFIYLISQVRKALQELFLDDAVFPPHEHLLQVFSNRYIYAICQLHQSFVDKFLFQALLTDKVNQLADFDAFCLI